MLPWKLAPHPLQVLKMAPPSWVFPEQLKCYYCLMEAPGDPTLRRSHSPAPVLPQPPGDEGPATRCPDVVLRAAPTAGMAFPGRSEGQPLCAVF